MTIDQRYRDSDCFLGWLQAEPDKVVNCKQVLSAAEDGKILIVTSALTIAEVLALRGRDKIPATERAKVEAFFRQEYIVVRNITRRISESARTFVCDYGVAPKAGVPLMNTFDKKLRSKSGKIGNPALLVEIPNWVEPMLPMEMPKDNTAKPGK